MELPLPRKDTKRQKDEVLRKISSSNQPEICQPQWKADMLPASQSKGFLLR